MNTTSSSFSFAFAPTLAAEAFAAISLAFADLWSWSPLAIRSLTSFASLLLLKVWVRCGALALVMSTAIAAQTFHCLRTNWRL